MVVDLHLERSRREHINRAHATLRDYDPDLARMCRDAEAEIMIANSVHLVAVGSDQLFKLANDIADALIAIATRGVH
jgi:hypothetical protein